MPINSPTTYQPTFLEQLLGKHYKWWYNFIYTFKSFTYYLVPTFFWVLSEMTTLLIGIMIWSFSNRTDSNEILQYVIIGNAFFALSSSDVAWHVSDKIYSGKLVNNLMYPSNLFLQFLSRSLANTAIQAFATITILIPVFLIYAHILSLRVEFFWLTLLVFSSFCLRFLINIIVGSLTFWTTNSYGTIQFYYVIFPLLAGNLIPLNFLPNSFNFLQLLPTAFTFYHPMQIYLGKYTNLEIFYVFLGGLTWSIILYFLAKLVFKMGLKKNESVGL